MHPWTHSEQRTSLSPWKGEKPQIWASFTSQPWPPQHHGDEGEENASRSWISAILWDGPDLAQDPAAAVIPSINYWDAQVEPRSRQHLLPRTRGAHRLQGGAGDGEAACGDSTSGAARYQRGHRTFGQTPQNHTASQGPSQVLHSHTLIPCFPRHVCRGDASRGWNRPPGSRKNFNSTFYFKKRAFPFKPGPAVDSLAWQPLPPCLSQHQTAADPEGPGLA